MSDVEICDEKHLIWIDLEMTGLDPVNDRIIEIATVITDSELNELAVGPVIAVKQSEKLLAGMDKWNQNHHGKSGLIDRVRESRVTEQDAENQTLIFLRKWVPSGKSPICGNSICQDRRFLAGYMPQLESYFHYRNLDVSTLKILARRWKPRIMKGYSKESQHEALQDVRDSIEELKYYREHFIKLSD